MSLPTSALFRSRITKPRLCLLLLGELRAETGVVRHRRCHGQQPHQRRLPYIFLLSRIAHYLKLIQRENIGTTKDRRLLELELNTGCVVW